MKTMKWIVGATVALGLSTAALAAGDGAKGVIGLNLDDPKPEGCVSCHANKGEGKDHRLLDNLAEVKKHRTSKKFASETMIPGNLDEGCILCHDVDFGPMMHDFHYNNPAENKFVNYYGDIGCLACHKMETSTDDPDLEGIEGLFMINKQAEINWTAEEWAAEKAKH